MSGLANMSLGPDNASNSGLGERNYVEQYDAERLGLRV
jgi:hypothetical protein